MSLNRGWSYREQVGPDAAGQTITSYLTATWRHSAEAEWAERLSRGEVEVAGIRARADAILHSGQTVVWHRPPWDEPPVPAHYEIVHEDDALLVIDKPSGLPTMPAGGFLDHTLLSLLRQRYPEARPLHRLGRHTSGLVLFARSHAASSGLGRAWRDHDVRKIYRALGEGVARTDQLVIDAPIGPMPHPRVGSVHAASAAGKPSQSVAVVLERRHDRTLFSVEITTGRPHQIRIHLACAGHPMIGDPLYDTGGVVKADPGLPGDGGYWLHAEQLQFSHPITGRPMQLSAAPPPELQTHEERSGDG